MSLRASALSSPVFISAVLKLQSGPIFALSLGVKTLLRSLQWIAQR